MRSWMQKLVLATVGVTSLFGVRTYAEPLDPATVPGDSKWVVHIDMDALRKSGAWKEIYDRAQKQPDFLPKVQELEKIFNARFPDDLHGVTLFGANFGDKTGVVLIDASVDRKQVEGLLAQVPKSTNTPRGDHSVLSWDDKGTTKYGSFFSDSKFLISDDKDSVAFALDVMDGKADALKPEAALAAGLPDPKVKAVKGIEVPQPGIMIYVAGEGLAKLKQQAARSPLLTQMKSAYITLVEDKDDIVLKLNVAAESTQAAAKMQQSAEGLRAMLGLIASGEDAKPGVIKLNEIVQKAVLATNGTNVSLEARLSQKQLPAVLDEAMKGK